MNAAFLVIFSARNATLHNPEQCHTSRSSIVRLDSWGFESLQSNLSFHWLWLKQQWQILKHCKLFREQSLMEHKRMERSCLRKEVASEEELRAVKCLQREQSILKYLDWESLLLRWHPVQISTVFFLTAVTYLLELTIVRGLLNCIQDLLGQSFIGEWPVILSVLLYAWLKGLTMQHLDCRPFCWGL